MSSPTADLANQLSPHTLNTLAANERAFSDQAMLFNFSYAPGTHQAIIDGFEKAGSLWSEQITDTYLDADSFSNKTTKINIFVNYSQLSTDNVLGGARPGMVRVNYKDYLTKTFQDISSAADWQAFRSLQILENDDGITQDILAELGINKYNTDRQNRDLLAELGINLQSNIPIEDQGREILDQITLDHIRRINRNNIDFKSDTFDLLASNNGAVTYDKLDSDLFSNQSTLLDNNNNNNNKKIWLTRANAKALGLIPSDDDAFDAEIAINSSILGKTAIEAIWDFDRVYDSGAGVDADKYDFLSVAKHEIGHVLGFVSGLDAFEMLNATIEGTTGYTIEDDDLAYVSPMDLHRYSDASRALGVFDWSVATSDRFFSIDGGETRIANFANGISAGGDGFQSSHWQQQDNPLGIMTPALKPGQSLSISDNDRLFLDVLGWELAGTEIFNDRLGLNLGIESSSNVMSTKAEQVGLNWKSLNGLLINSIKDLQATLTQEREAIVSQRQVILDSLENPIKQQETAIKNTTTDIKVKEEVIKQIQNSLEDLEKDRQDLLEEQQNLQEKIQEARDRLRTKIKAKDQQKIQAEIAQLEADLAPIPGQLVNNQIAQETLPQQLIVEQHQLSVFQSHLSALQNALANLVTPERLQAIEQAKAELADARDRMNNFQQQNTKLLGDDALKSTKEELSKIEDTLKIKLDSLHDVGDGAKRLKEEQKAMRKVMEIADEQELFWNQLIQAHAQLLDSPIKSEVRTWLAGSVVDLKAHMDVATEYQLGMLYETIANADAAQQTQWIDQVTQASLLLTDIGSLEAEEVAKFEARIGKKLEELLENSGPDGPLSRSRSGSTSSSWRYWLNRSRSGSTSTSLRYWQTALPEYMQASSYSEAGRFVEGVEQATLNQMLFSTAAPIATATKPLPEVITIIGLTEKITSGLSTPEVDNAPFELLNSNAESTSPNTN